MIKMKKNLKKKQKRKWTSTNKKDCCEFFFTCGNKARD